MKICIVGPGAMGCLFASFLARVKSDNEIWLLDKHSKRAEEINSKGIKVEGISGNFKVKVKAAHKAGDIDKVDLALICVKSYDTEAAMKHLKPALSRNSLVMSLQNGLGNIEAIAEVAGEGNVLGGVTSHGATLLGDGHIRHAGKGDTIIGRWQAPSAKQKKTWAVSRSTVKDIADIFEKAGFATKISDKVKDLIWSKLIINVGINALVAVTRLNNGRLVEHEGTRDILKNAVLEATKVARRKKISLEYSDPIKKVEGVCKATAGNVASMLQDVLKKRRTEIDYINGAIVREGADLGIKTPVNEVLTELVKTIETSYDKQVG